MAAERIEASKTLDPLEKAPLAFLSEESGSPDLLLTVGAGEASPRIGA